MPNLKDCETLKRVCGVCQAVPCLCPDLADLEEAAEDFDRREAAGLTRYCAHGFRIDRCAIVHADLRRPEAGCAPVLIEVTR